MAQAQQGNTVKVHYTGKLDDGSVFDSSANRDPIEFTIGEGRVIPGFENGIVGMNTGESKTISIPADQAYGPHREDMVVAVDKKHLPPDLEAEVGDQLQMRQSDGQPVVVTVADINDESITLDANHPLAGKDLTFDVELVEVS
ncbi:MAG: peptidylprolyl isomerase [Armatimonadota bacterium]